MRFLFSDYLKKSACTYYRQEVPHKTIKKLGLGDSFLVDPIKTGGNEEERLKFYLNCDSVFYYAVASKILVDMVQNINKFPVQDHGDDTFSWPPTTFSDIDDNIHFTNPFNPRFAHLGTRDLNGHYFKKGEWIWIALEKELVGKQFSKKELKKLEKEKRLRMLWKDGENEFDVLENRRKMKSFDKLFKVANGATFTTPRLEQYYKKALNLKNTYVFPNSVIFEDYPSIPIVRDKGTVKVLWQGGDTHYGDWWSIKDVLPWTTEKFDEVRWIIWGTKYGFIHETLKNDRWHFEPWVPYEAYKLRLVTIDFDFAVAPLMDSIFNQCKSCIRWYEVSALPEPKPILAARVPPYSDEIIDSETGLLYSSNDEFKVKFEALVRDSKLRDRLATNAKQWIRENRCADITVPPYVEWINETTDQYRKRRKRYARLEVPA